MPNPKSCFKIFWLHHTEEGYILVALVDYHNIISQLILITGLLLHKHSKLIVEKHYIE